MKKSALQTFALVFLSLCVLGLLEFQIVYASPYIDIDVDMAYTMIKNCSITSINLVVLDVRTQSEYDSGQLYGAVLIPHTELEARIDELTGHEDHEIIVYFRTARSSVIASEILDSHNFTKVYNMLGGIQAWQSAGYPITNPMETKATFWTLLIPELKLGLWNAWILILPFFIIWLSGGIINKRKWEEPPPTKMDKRTQGYRKVVEVCLFLYPIFLPLKLGTNWFQYGFAIYLLGIVLVVIAEQNFASTPVDRPVTKGVYSISRNPMYLGAFLVSIGIGIASASFILLLLAIVFLILVNFEVISEERFCLKRYGDSYQKYLDRTPRWIGIPKSKKK